jgi:ubiquinone/menaquinone biosynthesis C-methylase UbiE
MILNAVRLRFISWRMRSTQAQLFAGSNVEAALVGLGIALEMNLDNLTCLLNMSASVDLYDSSYSEYSELVYQEVRQETYGLDLGQTGWMTEEEFRSFFGLLNLSASSRVLEVGCGAGGCAIYLAQTLGAEVMGIDVNESGIRNAEELAQSSGVSTRVKFACLDGGARLPFKDGSFDAVFSNDAMCHIPRRLQTLKEWHRVLRPDGRMLFTDALVVTGILSNQEIATRSSIGPYFFLPVGENERLIETAGFQMLSTANLTQSAVDISQRWFDARSRRKDDLLRLEGESTYSGLQHFLACVRALSQEQRLSRFLYVASRPTDAGDSSWNAAQGE